MQGFDRLLAMLNVHENFFPSNINEFLQYTLYNGYFKRETFRDAIINHKHEILNFIRDQDLDGVKELKEK